MSRSFDELCEQLFAKHLSADPRWKEIREETWEQAKAHNAEVDHELGPPEQVEYAWALACMRVEKLERALEEAKELMDAGLDDSAAEVLDNALGSKP